MKILISQKEPSNLAPFDLLKSKFGASSVFKPFFTVEPLSAKEFRAQRIDFADFTAMVFSSRHTIDAFFALAAELRFKVPETMKYFCITELVANYLQKHIVYRKRKIFFGDGTPESVVALVGAKHAGEKFLICTSEGSNIEPMKNAFVKAGLDNTVGILVKSVPQDLSGLKLNDYGMMVLYNQFDVKSLLLSFPDFKQGDTKMIAYGKSVAKAMEEAGLEVAAQGPTPEAPSAAKTIELYLSSLKK